MSIPFAAPDASKIGPITADALSDVIRDEGSRLTASLAGIIGDLELAEDLVQDAVLTALERWPVDGVPDRPAAWLFTAARNKAIDRLRREARYREKLQLIAGSDPREDDDRLKLIFTCCHPALSREAQVALTLRTVCGLTTGEIARAFLCAETTIAQRLVRARRKIAAAGIPYRVPGPEELNDRLNEVLAVVYLMFNEGYLTSGGEHAHRPDLVAQSEWLARVLARLMPTEPEVLGLYSLIRLHRARLPARFDRDGHMVLLRDQDRSLWDHKVVEEAAATVVRAAEMRRPGPYQIQAAIVACHAEAPSWRQTDWQQILLLYDALLRHQPSPIVRLNRAVALRRIAGPAEALRDIEGLDEALREYRLFHAIRAELLRDLGREDEARLADAVALSLTENVAEQALLLERLG